MESSKLIIASVSLLLFIASIASAATIKSGASTDVLTIDVTSKAARVTEYDSSGRETSPQSKKAFTFVSAGFTPAATPTDLCVLTGSGSATLRVIAASFGGTATAAANYQILAIKRSAANTAGTFVAGTVVPHDSNDTSVAPTVGHYTANPTINGTVGTVARRSIGMAIPGTAGQFVSENLAPFPDSSLIDKPITLRGTTQQLALNGNSAALPAGAANWWCSFTWIED